MLAVWIKSEPEDWRELAFVEEQIDPWVWFMWKLVKGSLGNRELRAWVSNLRQRVCACVVVVL